MSATEVPPGLEKSTVVVIEDHPVNMALAEGILSAFPNIRLMKAVNGREGIQLVQAEHPALVLLDMNLPDISGLEVVRALSELLQDRRIHLVLLTGDSLSIEVVKALSLGAREYWPKPLTAERVEAGLRRALPGMARSRP